MADKIPHAIKPLFVILLSVGSCALFYLIVISLDALNASYTIPLIEGYEFKPFGIIPFGILGVNVAIMLVEWANIGWQRSAIKRLLFLETKSVRNDLFYFVLRVSGLNYVFAFVMSFGSVYILSRALGSRLDFDVLRAVPNLGFQFIFVVLVNSFTFYWAHRLMHTHGMFEIHKVHHSARELNVLTPTRNHPIDFMIMLVINTVPAAILGADPLVVTAYLGINGLYQCAVHSDITFLDSKLIRMIIITPQAHKIHHSIELRHYDMNFGIITAWDVLFGTYYSPVSDGELDLGVKDDQDFNTDRPIREAITVVIRWLSGLRKAFSG